ncbi:competence/damage-inducible protein A [Halobacteriaceae archaeon GCM10025711]
MRVAVVTVGDELLTGDIVNTNAAWLGQQLTDRGATVERVVTLPDDVDAIAETVAAYSDRYDAVVVTGGLGPTHDDLTMDAVAKAFGVEMAEHPEAADWIEEHTDYSRADLVAGTTHLPDGARMLPNDVGVAPGAAMGNVYVLPGVPSEMKGMFERVAEEFTGTRRYAEFVYADEPESALIDRMEAVQERFGVTVGSYPGEHVRLKLQSEDEATLSEATDWLREHVTSAPGSAVEVAEPDDDEE